jgi:hypothetical protein
MKKLKWEAQQRLRFIEAKIMSAEEVFTGDLIRVFGIGRAQATKDFAYYILELKGRIEYDAPLKRYVASEDFEPIFFKNRKELSLFLDFMERFR